MAGRMQHGRLSVQEAVLGELLPNIGKRVRSLSDERDESVDAPRTRVKSGAIRATALNSVRVPQSVVKRVGQGGCHNPKELRRQMNYVLRDEANVASWENSIGLERNFDEGGVSGTVGEWSSSWNGAPKRGHTDHIILSFPRDTDREQAEAIARQWGQEVFGSGWYRDRYRYVASLHHNTEHVHAHFIVDKVGMDEGKFLSISKYSEINYDMMREKHVEIAAEHGLTLNASTRLSRGIIENAPRQSDIQAARREGRKVYIEPLTPEQKTVRADKVRAHAQEYRTLTTLAKMAKSDPSGGDSWFERVISGASSAATSLEKGDPIMEGFNPVSAVPKGTDPIGGLLAARDQLLTEAQQAWADIQDMESGAEKVALQTEFAAQTNEIASFFGTDFMKDQSVAMSRQDDSFAVGSVDILARAASNEEHKHHADAMRVLDDFRSELEKAFAQYEDRLVAAGTSVEEVSARFTSASRTRAQVEALHPSDREERLSWLTFERELQATATDVYGNLNINLELQEDLVRSELLTAHHSDRLADIRALDRLVNEVKQDLAGDKLEQLYDGSADPLVDRINDPIVRQAVRSEIVNIDDNLTRLREQGVADLEKGREGRDSEEASTFANLLRERDREREATTLRQDDRRLHERADRGDDYGL